MLRDDYDSVGQIHPELNLMMFEGREGLDRVYEDWLRLMSRIREQSVFQHPAWYLAYFKSAEGVEPAIEFHGVYRGESLVAIFPLTFRRKGLIRLASLPRNGALYNSDCAISDTENKSDVWAYVRRNLKGTTSRRWDVFTVRGEGAIETSHIVQSVRTGSAANFLPRKPGCCDVIEVGDYESALAALKGRFRRDLNRRKKKMSAELSANYVCVTKRPMIEQAYDKFVKLEQAGWKGDSESRKANYVSPAAIGLFRWKYLFYRSVVTEFSKLDAAEICLIETGERVVGAQICVVLNDTSYMLKTCYDERARSYSPGHLLIDYLHQRYASEGRVKKLNMITDYGWHANWNPRKVHYLNITEFNSTILGLMLYVVYGTRHVLIRLFGRGR